MVKNNGIPIEVKKPVETVYELRNEIPSYEEFMKTYEVDDKIINSYDNEFKSQVIQGPQYGPGKKNFKDLYQEIKSELGDYITCKISAYSDRFDPNKNYSGVIIYAINGEFEWENIEGRAAGQRGRSFYIIIKSTENLRRGTPGQGIFHGQVIQNTIGIDVNLEDGVVCCGGFAYHEGELKFNSWPLNGRDQEGCDSDGKKGLSSREKILVKYCWRQYRRHGRNYVFEIPDHIDEQLD